MTSKGFTRPISTFRSRYFLSPAVFCALAIAALSSITMAAAPFDLKGRLLSVETNGIDSADCGGQTSPCRTIGRALRDARAGDTIVVGPGTYGDVNGDRDFNDPGDETPDLTLGCVICITKRVQIISLHGAAVTVINGDGSVFDQDRPPPDLRRIVLIGANNVVFGIKDHGFTLTRHTIGVDVQGLRNVRVAGNVAQNLDTNGFIVWNMQGRVEVSDNTAVGTTIGEGFRIGGVGDARLIIKDNTVLQSEEGFAVVAASGIEISGNLVRETGTAFAILGSDAQVTHNVLFDNLAGFVVHGSGNRIIENVIIGGRATPPSAGIGIGSGTDNRVQRNDIYGHHGDPFNPTACGLVNSSGNRVLATDNYWGAPTGPGPDPADEAGAPCDSLGSVTIVEPFATRPFSLQIAIENALGHARAAEALRDFPRDFEH